MYGIRNILSHIVVYSFTCDGQKTLLSVILAFLKPFLCTKHSVICNSLLTDVIPNTVHNNGVSKNTQSYNKQLSFKNVNVR
jgi:hypothetical protein